MGGCGEGRGGVRRVDKNTIPPRFGAGWGVERKESWGRQPPSSLRDKGEEGGKETERENEGGEVEVGEERGGWYGGGPCAFW